MLNYQGVPFKPAKVNLVDLQKLRVSSLVMSSSCANVVLWMYNYLYTNHISLQHVPVVSNNYHQLGIKSQFPNPNSKYSKKSSHMENVVNLVEFCISISEHLLNMSPKLTQKKNKNHRRFHCFSMVDLRQGRSHHRRGRPWQGQRHSTRLERGALGAVLPGFDVCDTLW